ncbi:uncharacterized protein B0I36DRAFT_326426 [Microdochium trichocladiopsis]|uniref:Uncharacterized protein n=1 Tax=Microdochium trichocladiopsis TaxID=1682393 RepID=A0A9P8Y5Q0_9PEZI|nr:uncharacterized protein B0I36DRAFT_326426 [Microdochium trichocladiopsis]KAH7029854.1 hypothetical protein B0I36DRAFT_326426 [Microdochium trichocladiopsis]
MAASTTPSSLDAFHTAMARLAGVRGAWGFIVVRTAFCADSDADEAQWTRAYRVLRQIALPKSSGDDVHGRRAGFAPREDDKTPERFALPVLADRAVLGGQKDLDLVRELVNQQVERYREARRRWVDAMKSGEEDDADEDDASVGSGSSSFWKSQLRLEGYLVVNDDALASLLAMADVLGDDRIEQTSQTPGTAQPHVIFLDATDPADVPYQGGSPFQGWMRAEVLALTEFEEQLDMCGNDAARRSIQVYPQRIYPGHTPVYNGMGNFRGVHGRAPPAAGGYVFPRGTPRGWEGTVATWESIPVEHRGRQTLGPPPAWFLRRQAEQSAAREGTQ